MLTDITYYPSEIVEIQIGTLHSPSDIIYDRMVEEVIYTPEIIVINQS